MKKYIIALLVMTTIAVAQVITPTTPNTPVQPVKVVSTLTAAQLTSVLTVLQSPPAGAAYSEIKLPEGKTAADIRFIGISKSRDGSGSITFVLNP